MGPRNFAPFSLSLPTSRRRETPSTRRIVERIYPRLSPRILDLSSCFFFKPTAINLTKGQVGRGSSSSDFNSGWCFTPIIGRRYHDGTPTFYFLSFFVLALSFFLLQVDHTHSLFSLLSFYSIFEYILHFRILSTYKTLSTFYFVLRYF